MRARHGCHRQGLQLSVARVAAFSLRYVKAMVLVFITVALLAVMLSHNPDLSVVNSCAVVTEHMTECHWQPF